MMTGREAMGLVSRLLTKVNGCAKSGCGFYLDTDTANVACAGRIPIRFWSGRRITPST